MEQQPQPPVQPSHPPQPPQPPVYYNQPHQPVANNPGDTLGIIGVILPFLSLALVGIILSILSYKKSKEANMPTTLGTIGIVINAICLVIGLLIVGFYIFIFIVAASSGGFDSSYRSY